MDWKEKAQYWIDSEAEVEAIHRPVSVELLKRAGLSAGHRVLDIGCGSGGTVLSAADMVGPNGSVTGIDIAPHMTARASERAASLTQVALLTGDAQSHKFEPEVYDIAISMFGMMFYSDPAEALSNILTSLRPKGRIVFASWAGGKDNPWFRHPREAAALHISDLPEPAPHAPGPLAFADSSRVLNLLSSAGWINATVEDFDLHLTPNGGPSDIAAMLFGFGPIPELFRARGISDEETSAVTEAIQAETTARLTTYDGPAGVRVPAKVRFFSALRSG